MHPNPCILEPIHQGRHALLIKRVDQLDLIGIADLNQANPFRVSVKAVGLEIQTDHSVAGGQGWDQVLNRSVVFS
jgi:hypothetical protein